ncbi:MAG: dihydrofolate reductase family protein [Bacteroidetes bacterium]|nr:dihydrofolate reductase family protein [Bacteroidota bacterium]
MRKLIVSLHISLDGYATGPNGEMNWILVNDELFDLVGKLTDEADTALYGRVTYGIMESYWPTAANQPGAGKHDLQHSEWYNRVDKIVISGTLSGKEHPSATFIGTDIEHEITNIKNQEGRNILLFGSPSVVRLLIEHQLVDEYWFFINPVILGKGITIFPGTEKSSMLILESSYSLKNGVVGVHYISR